VYFTKTEYRKLGWTTSWVIFCKQIENDWSVGHVSYLKPENDPKIKDGVYIFQIDVYPSWQRKGIGNSLIQEIMKQENITYNKIDWGGTTPSGSELKII